ncbi:MAG: YebC/PmpR family DNA-binding transcriptional regulator [Muribaculaceae bacterium]|nr:YebC/PmpR family DNA-binding transcriptional regulator [Muribaculaceae bacterium]
MGRAFEYRKARKLKRWGNMSRTFTRIGKEITIAAKAGGPDPSTNPRLRALMQNAKAANMPKDTVERAIKKATDKDAGDYKEIVYEGYGPFGIAIVVEAATDNNTRTVANVRSYFTKHGGTLGTQGSLSFMFDHKSVFKIKPKEGVSLEDLELELIDYGVDELEDIVDEESGDEQVVLYGAFEEYSNIQKYLEDNGFEIISSEFERIPHDLKEVTPEQRATLEKLLEKFEDDEDVQNVFHNMKEEDGDGE